MNLSFKKKEIKKKKCCYFFILILCCPFDQQRTKVIQVYFILVDIPLDGLRLDNHFGCVKIYSDNIGSA
jgi:hypothetical protein